MGARSAVFLFALVLAVGGCTTLPEQPQPRQIAAAAPLEPAKVEWTPLYFAPFPAESFVSDDDLCAPFDPHSVAAAPADLWERVRRGFRLDTEVHNSRVDAQLRLYAGRPELLQRVSERASWYMHYIVEQLDARGLPLELALLPIVESAYDPFAYSHGRASGLWQFIPETGRRYGLKQDWWADGRRDVIDSTRAAMDYLQDLHRRFDGDWLLALAAYNTGEGRLSREIRRNQAAGKPADFWSLSLPRETQAYVPKMIALSQIVADPESFGVELPPIPNTAAFTIVATGGQIDLAQAADLAGIDMDTLYRLNPSFNRWATNPAGPHRLLLPVDAAQGFGQRVAELGPEQRLNWEVYPIRRGDTLIGIARRYDTTPAALRAANNLRSNVIRAGDELLIPVARAADGHYSLSADQRLVRRQASGTPGTRQLRYVTQRGDSLWTIARRYGVTTKQLAHWNGMGLRDTLSVGRELVIWDDRAATPAAVAAGDPRAERTDLVRRIGYRVRQGDSLWRIARRFNLSIDEIVEWNELDTAKVLRPGQALTLYVDIRNSP